ncbi:sensor histidine kinase [Hwangdonia lutea]|uniref:Histidine kinase n=1 Tax=Hwangdonia lutea TaxID=3075823 RepID=A0AA97HQA8_9FLAO|nr:histidine kinase [Hwangdonia sp. SCSIO 19198]WOD43442.1 histidine kinase [Hwangdonia sp. SCSIO 19198]
MTKKDHKKYTTIITLLLNVFMLLGQTPTHNYLQNISALPDIEFYDITEDLDHFIWLAANKGLFRYNGNTYRKFIHPEQKSNSLFQLKFDAKEQLWCNNIYGQIFFIQNDSLTLFYDANKLVKGQLAPYQILEKSVRLFTVTGIYDIDKSTRNVTKIFEGMCIDNASFNEINYTFVINLEGSTKRHRIYKFENTTAKKILEIKSSQHIQTPKLFAFKDEVFFTHTSASGNIFYLINAEEKTSEKINTPNQLKDETIFKILKFNEEYWFLTSSGVFVFNLLNHNLIFKEHFFETESITDLEIDFNSNYWFTTLNNGVLVSPNLKIKFLELNHVKANITASVGLKNNNFVLGTNNGKLLFYKQDHLVKIIELPGKKFIGKLYFDTDNEKLIVSINASESFVVDLNTYKVNDVANTFSVAKTFSKINDSTLFYGNYRQGVVYKNPFGKLKKQVVKDSRVKASLIFNNHLFVSYIDGVFKYDTASFASEELKRNSKSLLVNSLTKSNDAMWLVTQHNGLLKFKNNTWLKSEIKLPNNLQINKIHADENVLWISTDAGLYQYQVPSKALKLLGAQDGLNTAVIDFLILHNQIIVTLPKAFFILPKTQDLFKTYKTSKVKVEAVKINDRDTLVASSYKLPYDLNKIGITFNSNGFQSNQHVKYQYRVKQIDSSWQNIPLHTHFVNFNSLSSGMYTFELKAQNISAKQPVFATPITFTIAKPYWETYWFYALVLATIIGLVWFYFRRRLQQKERQRIAEIDKILIDKKITNLRLENLRSQMNPHFIFNALNSIQDYIISNEKELASSYLVKFSRLIRMYLDYSQQNEITLEEELNALKLYLELEKVRFEDELEYKITIDNQLKTKQIKVPSLFIQPYVENALKHGLIHKLNNRKLHIEAKIIQQNKMQITVEDNGIGRAQSETLKRPNLHHKPFATKANEERVRLYKNKLKRDIVIITNDLYGDNDVAAGTKVVITMPIH